MDKAAPSKYPKNPEIKAQSPLCAFFWHEIVTSGFLERRKNRDDDGYLVPQANEEEATGHNFVSKKDPRAGSRAGYRLHTSKSPENPEF